MQQEITFEEAFFKLVGSRYLSKIELSVVVYLFISKTEVTFKHLTQTLSWENYRLSKAIKNLMDKKIIFRGHYDHVSINPVWKDWIDGKVAKFAVKVAKDQKDNFDENVTAELYLALIKFAKSRGLQVCDAEDAVMTSLLKAKEKYHQYKQGTNFKSWMFTIVNNTISDSRKKKKENQLFENELEEIVDTQKSVFDTLEIKSQMAQFKKKFSILPQYYQNLLTLYANEVPYRDMSVLLDIPEGTVKSRMHNAKQKFMELINEQ